MTVVGCDGVAGGTVRELWVDRSEPQIRYLEVATGSGRGKPCLVPMTLAIVHGDRRQVAVSSVTGAQFAGAPTLQERRPDHQARGGQDQRLLRGGHLYATPDRARAAAVSEDDRHRPGLPGAAARGRAPAVAGLARLAGAGRAAPSMAA